MHAQFDLDAVLKGTGLSRSLLETDPAVIYLLGRGLRIVYCNPAWEQFAAENDGKNLSREAVFGRAVLDDVPEPLQKFYSSAFAQVQKTGDIWEHDYECSSAKLYRLFHMRILPLSFACLLVENSLRIEEQHEMDGSVIAAQFNYLNEHGIVTICCHCRRALRVGSDKQAVWDWIPRFLAGHPGRVSHGLCRACRHYFYPYLQSEQTGKPHER